MHNELLGVDKKISTLRQPPWRRSYKYARRFVTGLVWVVGCLASILEIYSFGEDRHWWGFAFALSPEAKEAIWMLAVGVGGPWAMMLGGIAGAKFSELFTGDRMVTSSVTHGAVNVGSFFAVLHCVQMSFDMRIFPRFLSGPGFLKIAAIYLSAGLFVGILGPLVVHAAKRIVLRTNGKEPGRPTQRSSGRKPPKARFRRSPS